MFQPTKTLSSIRKHPNKAVCFILFLFIHENLIKYWSSTVNFVNVTAVLLTFSLHRWEKRMFNEKTKLFSDFQIQHTLSYIVRSFHLKRLIRLRVTQENESGCIFFWPQCILWQNWVKIRIAGTNKKLSYGQKGRASASIATIVI